METIGGLATELLAWLCTIEGIMVCVGVFAQGMFAARFLIQWLASERAGHSIMPVGFWFLSLFGGAVLFVYALWRRDPVFILGQGTGLFVYSRNIYMIWRDWKKENRPLFRPGNFFKQA
jgi:lipid-A-disaccharide synthase-like uncharacterized protein